MSAISDYLENKLINHILRNTAFTPPTKVYAALYKTDPTDADTGIEVSGGSYERKEITFSAPSNGETSNTADILFPEATSDWGNLTHFGIRDALTGGNLLFHGELTVNKVITSGDQLMLKAGEIKVTLD